MGKVHDFYRVAVPAILLVLVLAPIPLVTSQALPSELPYTHAPNLPQYIVLLDDSRLPYHPDFFGFNVDEFLNQRAPILADYRGPMLKFQANVAEMVSLAAHYYGVNPKVILTIMEVHSGLLSNPPLERMEEGVLGFSSPSNNPNCESDGLQPGNGRSLFGQLILLTQRLEEGYRHWRDAMERKRPYPQLTFADGSRQSVESTINPATFAVLYALAGVNWPERLAILVDPTSPRGFLRTYEDLFGENPSQPLSWSIQAGPYPATLKFPWEAGEEWWYTRGPHEENYSALDFAPAGSGCNESTCLGNWVLAAGSGRIVDTSPLWIKVDHGDGWITGYFHIPDQDKTGEEDILQGTRIGHPGCCGDDGCSRCFCDSCAPPQGQCGSSCQPGCAWCLDNWNCCSSGTHVHFVLFRDGLRESWYDKTISGWTLQSDNCFHKNGQTQCIGSQIVSDNYRVERQTKTFSLPLWLPFWYYLFAASDSRVIRVLLDGNAIFEAPNCAIALWVLAGRHTLTYFHEIRGQGTPTIEINPWPFVPPVCAAEPPEPPPDHPPGPALDNATFTGQQNYPPDTVVEPSQAIDKWWRMRNTGTTTWAAGYQLMFVGGEQMGAPSSVDLPASVAPGQEVNIHVPMVAPTIEGTHASYWRMRNPQGVQFGEQVQVMINVQRTGEHITILTADPPPPSNASTVRVHARVEDFPNFRAMRLLIDGSIVYEVGATEFYYDWNTTGYSLGEHSLVVEATDWSDLSWSRPERRSTTYTLVGGGGPGNHAPDRPVPQSPYNWYVSIGSSPELCSNPTYDPDGDVVQYYFETQASVGYASSGWISNRCWTPPSSLSPGTYEWRAKARDVHGAESGWSDPWHYSIESSGVEITELYFEPLDPNQEQVRIRACTSGHGGVNISLSVRVNTAPDGSDHGEWRIIKELGVPCFNQIDAPVWNTLDYEDGAHLVRVVATAIEPAASDVRDEVYVLNHRRPGWPKALRPVNPTSPDQIEWLNTRTVAFAWEPAMRATGYRLCAGLNPEACVNPLLDVTLGGNATSYTYAFDSDYEHLHWQVFGVNDRGATGSGNVHFGIDRTLPGCTVQPLPEVSYENVFQVSWAGTDNAAGVHWFDVQYRDMDHGEWTNWLTRIPFTKTYELFVGLPGHSYGFRCRATDRATNLGGYPDNPDSFTTVDLSARPHEPWWDAAYSNKRNIIILNNMGDLALPIGYPVHLHFDNTTNPSAAEIYNASLSNPKCNDLRVVYDNAIELDRAVVRCTANAIDIWFRTQVIVAGGSSDSTSHQLYYGNPNAGTPPGSLGTVFYPSVDSHTRVALYAQEGSGNVVYDYSGWGNDATIAGDGYWTEGKWGSAVAFPTTYGRAIYLGNPSSLNLGTLTVEGWFKVEPPYGWPWLASQMGGECGNAGEDTWFFQYRRTRLHLALYGESGGREEDTPDFLSDWAVGWHHYAFTFDGNVAKIYFDGVLRHTFATGFPLRLTNATTEFGGGECDHRVSGRMQNLAISDIARTDFSYGAFAAITNEPTTAVGTLIAPPSTGASDLAVLSLAAFPNPSGGALVQAVVRNIGNAPTPNGFFTDLYIDHLPSGPGDLTGSVGYWVASPIATGATITVAVPLTDQVGSHNLYIQVDSTGVISETDDTNNIASAGSYCFENPDRWEPDDSPEQAHWLLSPQRHTIHCAGDRDWLKFQATAGATYTIRTSNLQAAADTYLYLYDTDGTTLIAASDDSGGTLASEIVWEAPANGIYYLLVRHWNPVSGGCERGYVIGIYPTSIYLPLITRSL